MKKFLITAVALLTATVFEASAMSTARARQEALFLTDKMAYELDLTDYQYEAVYEINFDYFASLVGTSDILGIYWNRRANELGYVLTSWQYRRFLESEYFYRPVVYRNNVLHFAIYDYYAHTRFFRPAPQHYAHYHGNRHYHKAPHNNRHFADNRIGRHDPVYNPGHKNGGAHNRPDVKPNHGGNAHKPAVKPNNGSTHTNRPAVKPNNGSAHTNRPAMKPNNGGNTNRPAVKPNNGGNANKPAARPANVTRNTNNSVRAVATPARSASTTTRSAASSSSAGRRR